MQLKKYLAEFHFEFPDGTGTSLIRVAYMVRISRVLVYKNCKEIGDYAVPPAEDVDIGIARTYAMKSLLHNGDFG